MLAVIILAAGGGTRMKSSLPKVLHCLCGKPLIDYVVDTSLKLKPNKIIVVIGHEKKQVKKLLPANVDVVSQEKQLGTAHAVMQATKKLSKFKGDILILYGDIPLIENTTLKKLINARKKNRSAVSLATTNLKNPAGYGRIIRNEAGELVNIVEEKDATPKEKIIKEINTGLYCFESKALFANIKRVRRNNKQKEYYLTDVVTLLAKDRSKISLERIASIEAIGVNSRLDMSKVTKIMQKKINEKLMLSGVTIDSPENTLIEESVRIKPDCRILPGSVITGNTRIASKCIIGPNSIIDSCDIKEGARIRSSYLTECKIGKKTDIGPFSNVRPGTVVGDNAKIGAFSEIKKSNIGNNSKVPHLSYIGDSTIGKNVNVGAGTITCNYDGVNKHKTTIEDGAFIGSDTMLVAPIKVGKKSTTGAGSVLTKNVPGGSLGLERSEQKNIKGYSKKKGGK